MKSISICNWFTYQRHISAILWAGRCWLVEKVDMLALYSGLEGDGVSKSR